MASRTAEGQLELAAISREGSVRERVSQTLRAALISGKMRPGTLYSAPVLAQELGVSGTPVREAMLDLVRDGLVEVVRNKGFRVTEVTDRELDELAETRLLLEVPIMGKVAAACHGAVADEVRALRTLTDQLEVAAQDGDLLRFLHLDTEFHIRFLALHGNRELVANVQRLRNRTRLYGLEHLAGFGRLLETTKEHGQMIDLALARDCDSMEKLVGRHILHTRNEWAHRSGQ